MLRIFVAIILAGFLFLWICSCSKGSSISSGLITGGWRVVTDSAYEGVGSGNHQVVYIGHLGDSYFFDGNGLLYTNVNAVRDTFTYTIISSTGIILNPLSNVRQGYSDTLSGGLELTPYSLRIIGPYLASPGGIFGRTITLAR
jgi:hypothetical protein